MLFVPFQQEKISFGRKIRAKSSKDGNLKWLKVEFVSFKGHHGSYNYPIGQNNFLFQLLIRPPWFRICLNFRSDRAPLVLGHRKFFLDVFWFMFVASPLAQGTLSVSSLWHLRQLKGRFLVHLCGISARSCDALWFIFVASPLVHATLSGFLQNWRLRSPCRGK